MAEARVERFAAVGLGDDLRLGGAGVAGGALAVDGRLVHLAAFPASGNGGRQGCGGAPMARASQRRAARR